jgi:hypothetical protein
LPKREKEPPNSNYGWLLLFVLFAERGRPTERI